MKKRGFTLIELLAVLAVLAILAMITIPIVGNIVLDAEKSSAERSAGSYLHSVENVISAQRMKGNPVKDGTYIIGSDGSLCLTGQTCTDSTKIVVEMNGDHPTSGSVIINQEKIVNDGTSMVIGDYVVRYNAEGDLVAGEATADE